MGIKSEDTSPHLNAASSTASASIPPVVAAAARTPSLVWKKATTLHKNAIPGVDAHHGDWLGVINGNRVCAVVISRGHGRWQPFVSRHVAHAYQGLRTNLRNAKTTANLIARTNDYSANDGAALATSQGQAVQNLTDPPSPSPKEER